MFRDPNVELHSVSPCLAHLLRTCAARRGTRQAGIRCAALAWLLLGHLVFVGDRGAVAAEAQELFACTFQNAAI